MKILIALTFFLTTYHQLLMSQVEKWQAEVDKFVTHKDFSSASIGISISEIRTGRTIASHDAERSLIPASTLKILSSYAALHTAGKDYRYQTEFLVRSSGVSDSTLWGDLMVIGKGDPSFLSSLLPENTNLGALADTLVQALLTKGIRTISGTVRVNSDFIKDIPENPEWLWYDLGNYYGSGYYGFNAYENAAMITLSIPDAPDQICEILDVVPACLWENYCSEAVTVETGPFVPLYLLGTSSHRIYTVHGRLQYGKDKTISLAAAVPNPSETFECILKDALKEKGILFRDSLVPGFFPKDEMIYVHPSQTLDKLAKRALGRSVNLYAEAFLHLGGWIWNGDPDREMALDKMRKFYLGKSGHKAGVRILDGSGLSPKNRITAQIMTDILNEIAADKKRKYFVQLLPDVSQSGSLASRLSRKTRLKEKFRLKSGSMEGVRAYAGYIMNGSDPQYSISLMINNYDCSGDEIKKHISDFLIHLSQLK